MKRGDHKITVSAIISVYNGEKFIGRCLKSILSQNRKFDEIIVYDDASLDKTVSIIKKYMNKEPGCKIRLIQSDRNRGPGGGKNYARKTVTSDFFTFIDADDYVGKRYLEKFFCEIESITYVPDVVFGGFKKVNNEGKVLYKRKLVSGDRALIGNVQNWGNLYKRSFFEKYDINLPDGKVLDDVLTRGVIIGCRPSVAIIKNDSEYYYVENRSSVSNTYMKSFIPGIIDAEMKYLKDNEYKIHLDQYPLYEYWAYKLVCWHLLKSGTGVGSSLMEKEFTRSFELLKQYFSNYRQNVYISKKAPRGERNSVRIALKGMYILEGLKLHGIFLRIYSNINLSAIWPRL